MVDKINSRAKAWNSVQKELRFTTGLGSPDPDDENLALARLSFRRVLERLEKLPMPIESIMEIPSVVYSIDRVLNAEFERELESMKGDSNLPLLSRAKHRLAKPLNSIFCEITLVDIGYQIDIYNFAKENPIGTKVVPIGGCHDFSDNYPIEEMASIVEAGLLYVMERLESAYINWKNLEETGEETNYLPVEEIIASLEDDAMNVSIEEKTQAKISKLKQMLGKVEHCIHKLQEKEADTQS